MFESNMWLFLFRVPADDYKHLHLIQLNGIPVGDDAIKWFHKCTNIDAKIERGGPIQSADATAKWLKKLIDEGGPDYRSLKAKEQHLTLADMSRIKEGKPLDFIGLDDEPTPVSLTLQELQAKALLLSKKPEALSTP